jgi:hypothetical protein
MRPFFIPNSLEETSVDFFSHKQRKTIVFPRFLPWQGFYPFQSNPKYEIMKGNKDDATPKMKTLSDFTAEAIERGYVENFRVVTHGLTTEDEHDTAAYKPEQVSIKDFHRFEGYSDPQDNSIVYLIATDDGKKGVLIDAYGVNADVKIGNFIRAVEDIQKKQPRT